MFGIKRSIENKNLVKLRDVQQQIEELNFKEPKPPIKEILFRGSDNLSRFLEVLKDVLIERIEPNKLFMFFPPEYIKHMGEYLIGLEKYYYDSENYKEELSKLKTKESKIKEKLGII